RPFIVEDGGHHAHHGKMGNGHCRGASPQGLPSESAAAGSSARPDPRGPRSSRTSQPCARSAGRSCGPPARPDLSHLRLRPEGGTRLVPDRRDPIVPLRSPPFRGRAMPGVPLEDVREVSDYIAALEHGMARLRGGFPLSGRLIREIHAILLRSGRGSSKNPGEFRRGPVWLGGPSPDRAVFVPPPWQEVPDALAALERFLHDEGAFTP